MKGSFPIRVISGPPGSGKTTLAARLAMGEARGVHLVTDDFYRFLAHPIDPSKPASKMQNETVVDAFLAAATAYAAGGYAVYIDGVIGPWWLPRLRAALASFEYTLLMTSLECALARTVARESQPSASPAVVREMHRQFMRDSEANRLATIDTTDRPLSDVLDEFLLRAERGDFRLQP